VKTFIIISGLLFLNFCSLGQKKYDIKDISIIFQKTVDLTELQDKFNDKEKSGEAPLIILNEDGSLPENMIVLKFDRRVKIMTPNQLEMFKQFYSGDLDSYFIIDKMEIQKNYAELKLRFRKNDTVYIYVKLQKDKEGDWHVREAEVS
jgi:hypothetical protein